MSDEKWNRPSFPNVAWQEERDARAPDSPKRVYKRNIEELAKLIDKKAGRLTKISGKDNATLKNGRTLRGGITVYMYLFVRCDTSSEYIALTAAKSWYQENAATFIITTQNSVWKVELEFP